MGSRTKLVLRVSPNARHTACAGWVADASGQQVLRLRVAAPPIDGAANTEIIRFLADVLRLPRSAIGIDKGASGRNKLAVIDGFDKDVIINRINEHMA